MRTKPTTGQLPAREPGAHGITLDMRAVKKPESPYIAIHVASPVKGRRGVSRVVAGFVAHTNPAKDRTLTGKARRRARKAARA